MVGERAGSVAPVDVAHDDGIELLNSSVDSAEADWTPVADQEACPMETVAIVLSVGRDRVDKFEAGFHEYEVPVWEDLRARGLLARATLNRLDISSRPVD